MALCSEQLGVPVRTAFRRLAQARAYDALTAKEQAAVQEHKTTLAKVKRDAFFPSCRHSIISVFPGSLQRCQKRGFHVRPGHPRMPLKVIIHSEDYDPVKTQGIPRFHGLLLYSA